MDTVQVRHRRRTDEQLPPEEVLEFFRETLLCQFKRVIKPGRYELNYREREEQISDEGEPRLDLVMEAELIKIGTEGGER